MSPRQLALILASIACSACSWQEDPKLTQLDDGTLWIRVEGKRSCMDHVVIRPDTPHGALTPDGGPAPHWNIARQHGDPLSAMCVQSVVWPNLPPGFEPVAPPRPLEPGAAYRVTVMGPGWGGKVVFVRAAPAD